MHKDYYEKFIQSQLYNVYERDPIYGKLRELLVRNVADKIFLDVEELLHYEILFKLELGFKYGFQNGVNSLKNHNDNS